MLLVTGLMTFVYIYSYVFLLGPFHQDSGTAGSRDHGSRVSRWLSKPRRSLVPDGIFAVGWYLPELCPLISIGVLGAISIDGLFFDHVDDLYLALACVLDLPITILFLGFLLRPVGRHRGRSAGLPDE